MKKMMIAAIVGLALVATSAQAHNGGRTWGIAPGGISINVGLDFKYNGLKFGCWECGSYPTWAPNCPGGICYGQPAYGPAYGYGGYEGGYGYGYGAPSNAMPGYGAPSYAAPSYGMQGHEYGSGVGGISMHVGSQTQNQGVPYSAPSQGMPMNANHGR